MRLLVTGAGGMLGQRRRRRRARARGHDVVGADRAELDVTDAGAVARAPCATRAPDAVVNCAAYTDVDGAEADEAARRGRQRRRAPATSRAAAARGRRARRARLDRLRLRRLQARAVTSSPTRPARSASTARTKLAGEQRRRARPTPTHAIVRTAWLFGAGGKNFVDTMLAPRRASATRSRSSPTRSAARPGPATSPARSSSSPSARARPASTTSPAPGRARGTSSRSRSSTAPGVDCRVLPATTRAVPAPGARARPTACSAPSARDPLVLPPWQDGRRGVPRDAGAGMKLLVCGGAGFIGSNFVRLRLRDHGDEVVVLDKLTYAGRRENLDDLDIDFVHGAIEDADAVARGDRGRRRGRELRRRDARRPLDRRARRVRHDARRRHLRAARGGARGAACATCRSRPTRSTARSRRARSPRSRRSRRPRPTARRRPAPTCSSLSYFHTFGLRDA